MVILIYSGAGDALGLGLILQREAHDVTLYVDREDSHRVGDGLLPKTQDGVDFARNHADLVLFDAVGFGGIADSLRDHGVAVVGASRALDLLELDRLKAMHIFRGLGIAVPDSEEFPDGNLERAIAWVQKHPGHYIFKPSGNIGTDKTFIAEDAEEMALYLEQAAAQMRGDDSGIPPFLLQTFVEGAEVSQERWYAQGQPVRALDTNTLEAKKLLAGDLGPATGCQGNVVLDPHPGLLRGTVDRLDRFAAAHHISGPIDLNAIVDEKTRRPLVIEATSRFGWHALQAFVARWGMPVGETLDAIAHGELPPVRLTAPVGAAIPVAIPPFPNEAKAARGAPVVDDILEDDAIWPVDVMLDDDERLVCAGSDGLVYVIVAIGKSIAEAYGRCYDRLAESRLPDRMARVDLVEHAVARQQKLAALGFPLRA